MFAYHCAQLSYTTQNSSVQFSNFYSGLSDKHHHKDHCSVKTEVKQFW